MLMSPTRLIALRLYNITAGRWAPFSRLLRTVLMRVLIRKRSDVKYVQSSQYFSWCDLKSEEKAPNNVI